MKIRYLAPLLTCTLALSPLPGYAEAGVFQFRSMTIETANTATMAALEECRKRGYSVAVATVDRGGNLQSLMRDRFAGPHTVETAIRKAWTANSFRQSTGDLAGMLKEQRIPSQVANNPGALLVGGGLVIQAAGDVIGGIGVSGAPPGNSERDSIDGHCAEAGIKAINEILEFAE